MNKYPEMIIESASHTDVRGPDGYNMWLSDRRAKSTVDFIIERGIDPRRITGKGYGETPDNKPMFRRSSMYRSRT